MSMLTRAGQRSSGCATPPRGGPPSSPRASWPLRPRNYIVVGQWTPTEASPDIGEHARDTDSGAVRVEVYALKGGEYVSTGVHTGTLIVAEPFPATIDLTKLPR